MTNYNKQKRQESLDYLKAKGMWVLDNKYTPTSSVNTDITKTFEGARAEPRENIVKVEVKRND